MRIWQKIYFAVLLLFLLMLNLGLFFAARFIFSYNLTQEQKKAESECSFIGQNLEHDFTVLEQNGRYQDDVVSLLFESYKGQYKTRNISLELKKTEQETSPAVRSDVTDKGKKIVIFAERNLSEPYRGYRIYYEKRLLEFEETWAALKQTFVWISFCMSLLLCLILYVLMRRILKPLDSLNKSVAQIAAGKYGEKMPYKNNFWSRDEIGELTQNVNTMSETIQKQVKELKEENDKKQQLMDNMAHELRTPLTSVYGYAEFLRYAKASANEQYEGLTYIMEESMRLARMSETMLSMRLYEREEQKKDAVCLWSLAARIEKMLFHKLEEKELSLIKNFETETIYGEEELLVNLFRNLLENAVHASRQRGEIVWSARKEGEKLTAAITDYGTGMQTEELGRITEAFYRVDKARSRKEGGVGLGLSVVSMIVKKMDGTLHFSSEPGRGTTVTVIFTTS